MKLKIFSVLLILSVCCSAAFSQSYVKTIQDTNANFYSIQKSFNAYWAGKKIEKGKGWRAFRRWEDFMAPRVYPSGNLDHSADLWNAYQDYKTNFLTKKTYSNPWTSLGPTQIPTNGGAGRVNCIAFYPNNSNIFFVGSPSGGLWKTSDGGATWSTNTDLLPNMGVSDIAINPKNPSIMYIATGDRDAWDTYSVGILKSTDGGVTWNPTSLAWNTSQSKKVLRIIINPDNPDTVLAATSSGIYRTLNGGTTWTVVRSGSYRDLEFKPGDPSVVWAAANNLIWKSVNYGASFSVVTAFSVTGLGRINIATTANDANYLYVLGSSITDNSFAGVWKTTDGGTTFNVCTTTPNMLGWSTDGTDSGGQGWYDLSIAVCPTNKNMVFIGGVNIWETTNGGTTWTLSAHWYGGGGKPYVHADVHTLKYIPGSSNTLFAGCDGGCFKTSNNGTSWSDKSNGISIGQLYRIGCSSTNANLVMSGWQDNGSNLYNTNSWTNVIGGDGMDCMIDNSNASIMYGSLYYGDFSRSDDGGNNWNSIKNNITETGAWITPIVQDPVTSSTIYTGYYNLWKSTNRGNSWTKVSNFADSNQINFISIAPSNHNYIYIYRYGSFYKSTNGGVNWTLINSNLPVLNVTSIAVSPDDPEVLWASLSGYSAGEKVFTSRNGGTSWTNYSGSLPNIPANTIVMESGTDEGLYLGTDLGVFYRDTTMSDWIAFNTNLPNVIIDELEIQYATGKLRAGTYGRGLWETDLYHLVNIKENSSTKQNTLKIYPNPGDGIINIDLKDEDNKNAIVYVRIFNSAGRMVCYKQAALTNDCCFKADLSSEANGFYFVKVKTDKNNYSGTFVKNK